MYLEQAFPFLYGKKHGFVRRMDMKTFESHLRSLNFFDRYFRVEFDGMENIPEKGGALIVGNHGPFGFDAPFIVKHVYEERGRVVRPLADRAVFKTPIWRLGATTFGVLEGEPKQAVELLKDGNLVSVYPGGIRETVKRPDQKYEVRPFWGKALGFIKVALRAQVPIIPVACIGIDDMVIQLRTAEEMRDTFMMRRWQEDMGSDKYTMPLWMGLGPTMLPLPVKFNYYVGWPIHLGYGPEAADNPEVLKQLRERVIVELEQLLQMGLAERERRRQKMLNLFGIGGRRFLKGAQQAGRQLARFGEELRKAGEDLVKEAAA